MTENNSPVFSVITPTCKRSKLLRRAIESVRSQTFTDYEHIIIDDGNELETKETVKDYHDEKIIFHQHLSPKGAAGGYNSGIKLARGKFISFLDDDDEYLPEFFEKVYEHLTKTDPEIGFVWTGISMMRDSENGEIETYSRIWPAYFRVKEAGLVAATTIGNGFGLCARKECVEKTGMYDESLTMGQDADYLFRMVRNSHFETIPFVLVRIHRHYGSQLTDSANDQKRLAFREKILERHSDLLKKYPLLYLVHYRHIADLSYGLNLRQKGRSTMIGVIRKYPFYLRNYLDFFAYEIFGKDFLSAFYLRELIRDIRILFKKLQIHEG